MKEPTATIAIMSSYKLTSSVRICVFVTRAYTHMRVKKAGCPKASQFESERQGRYWGGCRRRSSPPAVGIRSGAVSPGQIFVILESNFCILAMF